MQCCACVVCRGGRGRCLGAHTIAYTVRVLCDMSACRDCILQYAQPDAAAVSTGTTSSPPQQQQQQPWARCVDLGCGTGLMGPLLRPHTQQLAGVDLSAGMVQKARERGCYDELAVDELVQFLEGAAAAVQQQGEAGWERMGRVANGVRLVEWWWLHAVLTQQLVVQPAAAVSSPKWCSNMFTCWCCCSGAQPFDLLVAADVLVYIGDLASLLTAAANASTNRCVVCGSGRCHLLETPCGVVSPPVILITRHFL